MTDEGRPIAWTALRHGTPVVASDGEEIGKVADVVADENKDIFSGVALRQGLLDGRRFIPATLVDEITDARVRVTITSRETDSLAPYEG